MMKKDISGVYIPKKSAGNKPTRTALSIPDSTNTRISKILLLFSYGISVPADSICLLSRTPQIFCLHRFLIYGLHVKPCQQLVRFTDLFEFCRSNHIVNVLKAIGSLFVYQLQHV